MHHRFIPKKRIIPRIGKIRDPETGEFVQGVITRDPKTQERLPAGGILVDRVDSHWRRQARVGGVRIEDEPEATPEAPTTITADRVLLGSDCASAPMARASDVNEHVAGLQSAAVVVHPAPASPTGPIKE